jgi:hypothetical protein
MHETSAREIERKLELLEYWLDREEGQPETIQDLMQRLASELGEAPEEVRQAVLGLAVCYREDPADGQRIARAIKTLLDKDG